VIAVGYLIVLLAGVVFSFVTVPHPYRTYVRIATALLSIPICLLLAMAIFFRLVEGPRPPSIARLQRDFPKERADLETILRMSDEDSKFSWIAPDFVDQRPGDPSVKFFTRFKSGDPKANLSEPRWALYRQIFLRNGIHRGIQRDLAGDAFIMVRSSGILDVSLTSGFLHCAQNDRADPLRFDPCLLHQDQGKRQGDSSRDGYSFQRLDGDWYAYYDGS
jgi:hypothetical protein